MSDIRVSLSADYPVAARVARLEAQIDAMLVVLNTQGKALSEARRALIVIAEDNQKTREVLADALTQVQP